LSIGPLLGAEGNLHSRWRFGGDGLLSPSHVSGGEHYGGAQKVHPERVFPRPDSPIPSLAHRGIISAAADDDNHPP
jgi:hypothetical protein